MSRYTPIDAPKSSFGVVAGAAVGALIGAVVVVAYSAVQPTTLYAPAATQVRPAVAGRVAPMAAPMVHNVAAPQYGAPMYAAQEAADVQMMGYAPQQSTPVFAWAFAGFATVAAAVTAFFWKSNTVAMAATTGRREALMSGVAAAGAVAAQPAFAAYGDSANVFGKRAPLDQLKPVSGDGWTGFVPGKFNPSKERSEFEGTVARWEDNFDQVSSATMVIRSVGKNSVTEMGSIDEFRNTVIVNLLGKQAWEGSSISEGGFQDGQVSKAALLGQESVTKDGKTYYTYEILTRTADGNEGGRHQLFSAACSNGNLYVMKQQAGDKRWFFGLDKELKSSISQFTVA
jgi:hypothetical protein